MRLQPAPSAQYASMPMISQQPDPQQRAIVAASQNVNQIETYASDINAISTIATSSTDATATDPLTCNYRNCSGTPVIIGHMKPNRKSDAAAAAVAFQAPQSSRSHKSADAHLALIRNQSNQTILPPPLFDENIVMSTATLPLLPNDSVRQMKRRHHRTIPRHFTLSDPKAKYADDPLRMSAACSMASGSVTLNKKALCHCPTPHIPMSYMGSAQLNIGRPQQNPNEMIMNTLSRKWPRHKSNVSKSASFTSNISSQSTIAGYNRNSASGLLSATHPQSSPSAVQSRSTATASSVANNPKPAKITTISKQIGNNEINGMGMQPQSTTNEANDTKSMQELLPINITPNKSENGAEPKVVTKPVNVERMEGSGASSPNPILPPKQTKSQSFNRPAAPLPSAMSKSYTATSTTSTTPNQMSVSVGYKNSHRGTRDRSKSPIRDKTYSLATPIVNVPDQKSSHIKTTYPTTSTLTIANNHATTLPKPVPPPVAKKPAPNPKPTSAIVNNNGATVNSTAKHLGTMSKVKSSTLTSNANETNANALIGSCSATGYMQLKMDNDKALPVCTTVTNCSNPKEHFLPNDTSLDDDYLSECENCKSGHGSRYYLDKEHEEQPHETMTLQRKMDEKESDEQTYYRTSSTLPTNTKQKTK